MQSRNIDLSYLKVRDNMTEIEAKKEFKERLELIEKCYRGEVEDYKQALELGVKALEKQIPKKPRKTDSYRGVLKRVYAYVCPTCGNACLEKYMNERNNTMFCWNCGQKLDWSDEK